MEVWRYTFVVRKWLALALEEERPYIGLWKAKWRELGQNRHCEAPGRDSNRLSLDSRFLLSQIAVEVQIISEKTILLHNNT